MRILLKRLATKDGGVPGLDLTISSFHFTHFYRGGGDYFDDAKLLVALRQWLSRASVGDHDLSLARLLFEAFVERSPHTAPLWKDTADYFEFSKDVAARLPDLKRRFRKKAPFLNQVFEKLSPDETRSLEKSLRIEVPKAIEKRFRSQGDGFMLPRSWNSGGSNPSKFVVGHSARNRSPSTRSLTEAMRLSLLLGTLRWFQLSGPRG